jgi:hypothetical protein
MRSYKREPCLNIIYHKLKSCACTYTHLFTKAVLYSLSKWSSLIRAKQYPLESEGVGGKREGVGGRRE